MSITICHTFRRLRQECLFSPDVQKGTMQECASRHYLIAPGQPLPAPSTFERS